MCQKYAQKRERERKKKGKKKNASHAPRRRDDDGVARRAGDRKMRCRCERHKDDPVPNRQSVLRELPVHEERGFLREGGGNFKRYEYRGR